jgi:hypothetical protein
VAIVAEDFEVVLVVEAGDAPVAAAERLDVVYLQTQLVAAEEDATLGVFLHVAGLEAAALAGPLRAPAGGGAGVRPDMVPDELPGVLVGAVSGATAIEGRATSREPAEGLGDVDAGYVVTPGRCWRCHNGGRITGLKLSVVSCQFAVVLPQPSWGFEAAARRLTASTCFASRCAASPPPK